jgi:hypothetical protein
MKAIVGIVRLYFIKDVYVSDIQVTVIGNLIYE